MKLKGLAGIVLSVGLGLSAVNAKGASVTYEDVNIVEKADENTWKKFNGHEYRLTPSISNWVQAEQYAVSEGGHLVTINDAIENNWIRTNFQPSPDYRLFIGLYQQEPRTNEPVGGWEWISGQTSTFINWRSGEPNNVGNNEHWANIEGNNLGGTWNDIPLGGYGNGKGVVERNISIPFPSSLLVLGAGALAYAARRKKEY